jgi:hypothetical protein
MQYIHITSTRINFETLSHEFIQMKICKIQSNETVNTIYVPNGIRIPTHGGDLGHHGLRMEERRQESPMEPPQGKRGGRKKERKKEKKGRDPFRRVSSFGVTESRHVRRHDLCMSHTLCSGMAESTWQGVTPWSLIASVHMTRLLHKSYQPD